MIHVCSKEKWSISIVINTDILCAIKANFFYSPTISAKVALYPILDQDVGCSFLKLCHCIIIHIDISEVIHHNNDNNGHTFYTNQEYK